jgi:VanZ family protein
LPLLRRHKYLIAGLAVYWPLLFIATHIPIHDLGRRTGMSDKTMHWLAYLGLVFFIWLAVSPYEKVNWKKAKVWGILAVLVWYGAVDEWLQSYVGRGTELADFFADMRGTLLGLAILTFFSFWPAALVVTAIFTFTVSNMARLESVWNQPYLDIAFQFASYSVFTLLWVQYLDRKLPAKVSAMKWMASSLVLPVILLAVVKLSCPFFGEQVWLWDCLTAIAGIILSVIVSRFICKTIWEVSD